jgi:asparagine synthase (glutamine-hydrolysing)
MILQIANHHCSFKTYYELAIRSEPRTCAPDKLSEYSNDLLNLLRRSVQSRLHSDVPLGSCLSGGIDSSAIVCLGSGILRESTPAASGDRQKVFTACYQDPAIDESNYAQLVAEKAGASWHPVYPQAEEMAHDLADLVYCQELPFGSTSIYAQYRIMKAVHREGIKVLLDGQGGDELFGGYPLFFPPYYYELFTHFLWHELGANVLGIANSPFDVSYLLRGVFKNIVKKITPAAIKNYSRKKIAEKDGLLNREFSRACQHRYQRGIEFEFFSLNKMLGSYMTGFHLKQLLRYEDRNSMRFAIESRTPFADDNDLIAYAFQIPAACKIHQGWSKFLLRRALAGIVPEQVLWRRDKIAFATPEASWLRQIKHELRSFVSRSSHDLIDTKTLNKNWDSLFCALPDSGFSQLWRVINFLMWESAFKL